LNGYLCLIEYLWKHGTKFAEGWNFGPNDDDCKPVSWIVTNLSRLWDGDIRWELDSKKNPHEAMYRGYVSETRLLQDKKTAWVLTEIELNDGIGMDCGVVPRLCPKQKHARIIRISDFAL
ncbi:MAG: hypothetical protein JRE64_28035, partial [Deltaproteobacteria bacterium]|nr:hypothetical protein [Deltaproteobacteria bacterium]